MQVHSNTSDVRQELLDACMVRPPLADDEYYVIPVIPIIPMEDPLVHTSSRPFCADMRCPCHEDWDNRKALNDQYYAGLLTWSEAIRMYQGGGL